jgi:solute carrier family 25 oxoglutarate transporter 11
MYTGLTAAWLRQIFYASTRFGIYHTLQDSYKRRNPGGQPGFLERTFYSLFAGAVGAYVGTPPDLALLRMQADISLPPEKRRNYKNVFDAISRIIREEGFTNLWRGATPTVFRAMAMNFGMLVNFDVAKDYLVANVG